VITVYADKSFSFITKTPPMSYLIKKELGLKSGSKVPNKEKVGKLTKAQVEKIVKIKLPDLNCDNEASAAEMVIGSARSMGVEVEA
jgi:large subunit ribosomal protein L11